MHTNLIVITNTRPEHAPDTYFAYVEGAGEDVSRVEPQSRDRSRLSNCSVL